MSKNRAPKDMYNQENGSLRYADMMSGIANRRSRNMSLRNDTIFANILRIQRYNVIGYL